MRMILSILILACIAAPGPAQERPTGSVRGTIFDPPGRKGVAHALVSVVGVERGSETDENGRFQIDRVPPGKWWLSILSSGMTEAWHDFTIVPGDTATVPPIYLRYFGLSDDQAAAESIGVDVPWGAEALSCEIRSARKAFHVGDHPDFQVTISNRGNKPLNLVYSLDGSEGGRYPRVKILIEALDGGSLTKKWVGCGNTNYLGVEDFVLVEPGQTIDPYAKGWNPLVMNETFERPGRYLAKFTYSTRQSDIRRWVGFGQSTLDPRISELIRRVPLVELTATTEFTVAE